MQKQFSGVFACISPATGKIVWKVYGFDSVFSLYSLEAVRECQEFFVISFFSEDEGKWIATTMPGNSNFEWKTDEKFTVFNVRMSDVIGAIALAR